MYAVFIVEIVVVFLGTLGILHYFGNIRRTHVLVTLAVFVSWFFSFLIVFILPMDVSNTFYDDCLKHSLNRSDYVPGRHDDIMRNANPTLKPSTTQPQSTLTSTAFKPTTLAPGRPCVKPWSHVPPIVLPYVWRVVYWSSMLLSWILMPIMQSYVYAGDFTLWGKLKTAFKENSLWYVSYIVIFIGLVIYVGVDPTLSLDIETLKLICITTSNTWGLILLVILMGYGLTELPRHVWNMSMVQLRLEKTYFKVAQLSTEKEDAQEELTKLLTDIKKASEEIKLHNPLRRHLNVVIGKCPIGSESLFSKGTEDHVDTLSADGSRYTTRELVKLHKNLIVMSHRATRTQFQWNAAVTLAFYLEDVTKAELNPDKQFIPSFTEHSPSSSTMRRRVRWYYELVIKPCVLKVVGVVLFVLSVTLIWSEITFFSSNPTVSLFALLIEITHKYNLFFSMEIISCVLIAYMCVCTYYTVFKIKFFNYYYFAGNHQTDSNSLLFSGYLFCRLTYALCLNFLAMIHMDGHITGQSDQPRRVETNFTVFMGHMDILAFISKGFNIYYPMILILVCFSTYFRLGRRCLHCCGADQFLVDDDFSSDLVRDGKDIAKRERRKLERQIKGTDWSERTKEFRNKYSCFGRDKDVRDPGSANSDESPVTGSRADSPRDEDSSPKVSIKTRLGVSAIKKKYTSNENDRQDLLENAEYAPPDTVDLTTQRGYNQIGGTSRSSVPRGVFDDV